ncbi:hypothetical protein N7454_009580 [Penicillium verhagenii]|nr:hypothetical protein N7454_009580 [Penicillium verhagenii]
MKTPNFLQRLELEYEIQKEKERRERAELETREHARKYEEIYKTVAEYETKIEKAEAYAKRKENEAGKLSRALKKETRRAELKDWYIQRTEETILKLEKLAFSQRERAAGAVKSLQLKIQHGEDRTKKLREMFDDISAIVRRQAGQITKNNNEWVIFHEQLHNYGVIFGIRRKEISEKIQKMQDILGLSEEALHQHACLLNTRTIELDARCRALIKKNKELEDKIGKGLVARGAHIAKNQKKQFSTEKEKGKQKMKQRRLWKKYRRTACTSDTDSDSSSSTDSRSSSDSFDASLEPAYHLQLVDATLQAKESLKNMPHQFDMPWSVQRMTDMRDGVVYPDNRPPPNGLFSLYISDGEKNSRPATASNGGSLKTAAPLITGKPRQTSRKRVRFEAPNLQDLGDRDGIQLPSLPKRRKSKTAGHPLRYPRMINYSPLNRQGPGGPVVRQYAPREELDINQNYQSSLHTAGTQQAPVTPLPDLAPREAPNSEASFPWPSPIYARLFGPDYLESHRRKAEMIERASPSFGHVPLPALPSIISARAGSYRNHRGLSINRPRVADAQSTQYDDENINDETELHAEMETALPDPGMPGMWPNETPVDDRTNATTHEHVFEPFGDSMRRIFHGRRYQLAGGIVIFGVLVYAYVGQHAHHLWMAYNEVPPVALTKLRNAAMSTVRGSTPFTFNVMKVCNHDRSKLG